MSLNVYNIWYITQGSDRRALPPAEFIFTRTWSPPGLTTDDITSCTDVWTGSISVTDLWSNRKISYNTRRGDMYLKMHTWGSVCLLLFVVKSN